MLQPVAAALLQARGRGSGVGGNTLVRPAALAAAAAAAAAAAVRAMMLMNA